MEWIILGLGAYLLWRMASEPDRPSQKSAEEEAKAQVPTVYLDQRRVFMVNRFLPLINDVASKLAMDANIIKAVIYHLSGGDDGLEMMHPDGEYGYGLMQITCSRARTITTAYEGIEGVSELTDCILLRDAVNSVWYGASYLRALYRGDWKEAIAKYYSPTQALFPREDALQRADQTLAIAQIFDTI
jgi:hypothetical protein